MQYIAFDASKHYTLAAVESADGRRLREWRVLHEGGALRQFLEGCERGSPVAVICRHRRRHPKRHVSQLYERVARRKGHQKAVPSAWGAVRGRHVRVRILCQPRGLR